VRLLIPAFAGRNVLQDNLYKNTAALEYAARGAVLRINSRKKMLMVDDSFLTVPRLYIHPPPQPPTLNPQPSTSPAPPTPASVIHCPRIHKRA